MSTSWLRKRRARRSQPAILQSSAAGLIHFPTPTLQSDDDLRPTADLPRSGRIVVGVTHDRAARNALRWAARAALSADATLVVVTTYNLPCPVPTMYGWAYIDEQAAEDTARFMQRNVLYDELRGQGLTDRIRPIVTRGDPASVLVATARHADMLVIGHREGRRRLSLARSVSKGCVKSAECPVVVVREDASGSSALGTFDPSSSRSGRRARRPPRPPHSP